jgi:hypothetical protein
LEPESITAWKTAGLRRAFLVKPFRPADVVPGAEDEAPGSPVGVGPGGIFAGHSGCRDRLEPTWIGRELQWCSALALAAPNSRSLFSKALPRMDGAGTDPSPFPEGLANAPASHVALWHGLRGPNITIGSRGFAGESALIQAASLLGHGQADLAIVLAGDTLTRAVYEWYDAAGLLSPACNARGTSLPEGGGFVPSEGVVALVLEPAGRKEARSYAHFSSGRCAAGGKAVEIIGAMLDGAVPSLTVCAGNGAPCAASSTTALAREISGHDAAIVPAQAVAAGLADAGALLHLILALSSRPRSGHALLLGTSGDGGFAALLLELP